jgi:methylthioribose-1-phosphate isomerase
MNVNGKQMRPIWLDKDQKTVKIIDQRRLPHELVIVDLTTVDDAITAIKEMYVRGAPLIGVTAAYAVFLATLHAPALNLDAHLAQEGSRIKAARPTAVNLAWAVDRMLAALLSVGPISQKIDAARREAARIAAEEVEKPQKKQP